MCCLAEQDAYTRTHTQLLPLIIPDPLGERSPLPASPSPWPALEEFGDWKVFTIQILPRLPKYQHHSIVCKFGLLRNKLAQ